MTFLSSCLTSLDHSYHHIHVNSMECTVHTFCFIFVSLIHGQTLSVSQWCFTHMISVRGYCTIWRLFLKRSILCKIFGYASMSFYLYATALQDHELTSRSSSKFHSEYQTDAYSVHISKRSCSFYFNRICRLLFFQAKLSIFKCIPIIHIKSGMLSNTDRFS